MPVRPVTRIIPLTEIREERLLPFPGKVVVSQGQMVKPRDVIAETQLTPKYHLVDVARSLGVSRTKAAEFILCQAGDMLRVGDTIARKKGLLSRIVRSPVDGKVIVVDEGQVLIEEYREPYLLRAGMPAKVSRLIPDFGAELATTGMVVDGVWGNGKYNYGLLRPGTAQPSDALASHDLSVEKRGLVLVAGTLTERKTLEIADSLPLRGLILGSMRAELVPFALKVSFPIIVLEGFGVRAMNPAAFKLLVTSEGQRVALFAMRPKRGRGLRPTVIAPLPSTEHHEPPPRFDEVKAGSTVWIVRSPYLGAVGRVISIPPGLVRFPNGVRARAAEVRLGNGRLVMVPLANLEILVQS